MYAQLTPSDLEETDNEGILSYQCRCGSSYLVQKNDLEQINCVVHISCQDCSFIIAVET
jgi:DNA-directed RNA polymerase subunit RPC12/RpoP